MGFFKKVKKAVKKVGKAVEKVAKPVVKKAVPIAATAIGAYFGGPAGAAIGSKASEMFGAGSIGDALGGILGNSVSQGIQQTATEFGNSLVASKENEYGGIPYPNQPGNYGNYSSVSVPNTGAPSSPLTGYMDGVQYINGIQTPVKSAAEQGKDTRDYLAAAYPEMNPWERSGTGGTMFGSDMTGQIMSQEATNKQLASQLYLQQQQNKKDYDLAKLNSLTQLQMNSNNNTAALMASKLASDTSTYNAGLQSVTSRANTRDNVQLGYSNYELAKTRLDSDVMKIAADTDLSKQNKEESISRTINNYAQQNNIKLTGEQIKAMTASAMAAARESGARTGLVGEQTESERLRQPGIIQSNENLRYGQGTFSKEALGISNAIGDAAGGIWDNVKSFFNGNSDGVSGAIFNK